jgi:hypothetical protein
MWRSDKWPECELGTIFCGVNRPRLTEATKKVKGSQAGLSLRDAAKDVLEYWVGDQQPNVLEYLDSAKEATTKTLMHP